jgi:DNA-directed RNA polymerase beta' subunit
MKELTLKWSTKSGLTMAIDDVKTPESKKSILDRFEDEAEKVERSSAVASSPTASASRRRSRSGRRPPPR